MFRETNQIDASIGGKGVSRAEDVLPQLDLLLLRNDLYRGQIGRVAVSTGPGSFTGIKIGISIAMGLADGLGCPVVGLSALEAMACGVESERSIFTAVPVGRDLVAAQHFARSGGKVRSVSNPRLLTETHFIEESANVNGVTVLHSSLIPRLSSIKVANIVDAGPNIASLIVRGDFEGQSRTDIIPLFIDRKPPAIAG